MANHAYVVPKQMPPVEQIDRDVREICARKFPMFTLEFNPEQPGWDLSYKNDGYIGLVFWISDIGNPDTFDEATETWGERWPCIEFRHGHGEHVWLWWVEYEI